MRTRGSTLRLIPLIAPLLCAPFACSLLVESTLSEKPMNSGGEGGAGGPGGPGGGTSTGDAGAPPCGGGCSPDQQCCTETCADLDTSAEHCGACGNACAAGEKCCGGSCAECCSTNDCPQDHICNSQSQCELVCQSPSVACVDFGVCADLDTTIKHCGACGNDCLAKHDCVGGVCQSGWATMTTAFAPMPRRRAAAAWTGSALFVWGGQGTAGALGDGALYDPSNDAWKPVSTTDAPEARLDAVAVWIGDRVLVWGGGSSTDTNGPALSSGALYDPQTDTWTAIAMQGGLRQPVALWTGSKVLVWGGLNNGSPFSGGYLYDPQVDTWSPISTANIPTPARSNVAWVWSGQELLIFGGRLGGNGSATNEGYGYNPSTNAWRKLDTVNAPAARYDAFAVWLEGQNGQMMIFGGRDGSGPLEDAQSYDPVTNVWGSPLGTNLLGKRSAPWNRSGWVGFNGARALFAGGLDTAQKLKTDGQQFDPSANMWAESMPTWSSGVTHEYGVGVWTGVELILWSGLDNGVLTAAGERYRP